MLAYRARYYVGVLTYLFNVAVYYFIWRAVFANSPTVVGLSLAGDDHLRRGRLDDPLLLLQRHRPGPRGPGAGGTPRDEPDPAGRLPGRDDRRRRRTVRVPGRALHGSDRSVVAVCLPAPPPASVGGRRAVRLLRGPVLLSRRGTELPRRAHRDPDASRFRGILRAKYLVARASLRAPDPDDPLPGARAHDPPRLPLPAHQLHPRRDLPRQGGGRGGRCGSWRSRPGWTAVLLALGQWPGARRSDASRSKAR